METIHPFSNNNNIAICFAINDSFAGPTAVMIQSIIEKSDLNYNYDILILYSSLSEYNKDNLLSLIHSNNISIRFLNVSHLVNDCEIYTTSVYTDTIYSKETYYRLLIPDLLTEYDKILYLDGDMVVLSDVSQLYKTDVEGYLLASTRDYSGIASCYNDDKNRLVYRRETLKLKTPDDYFLAGMLVLNCNEFRRVFKPAELMSLAISKEWRQHDQDILNMVCQDKVKLIDPAWDYLEDIYDIMKHLPKNLLNEYNASSISPKIIHYAGGRKPWVYPNLLYAKHFWKYAFNTPYFEEIYSKIGNDVIYKYTIFDNFLKQKIELDYWHGSTLLKTKEYEIGQIGYMKCTIETIDILNDTLMLSGCVKTVPYDGTDDFQIYVNVNKKSTKCDIQIYNQNYYVGKNIRYYGICFKCKVKLDRDELHIKFLVQRSEKHRSVCKYISFGNYAPLSTKFKSSYYCINNWIVSRYSEVLLVQRCSKKEHLMKELFFMKEILHKTKFLTFVKTVILRGMYHLLSPHLKNDIWLVADRSEIAKDNGEAFFKYLCKTQNNKPFHPIFVISKKTTEYKRMSEYGDVLPYMSKLHKIYFLFSKKVISSQFHYELYNPYSDTKECVKDLTANKDFIFLQHGIIKDDMSKNLKKSKYNFNLFITSTQSEHDSILRYNYGYDEKEILLSGLARFDYLYNDPKKIITIAPTWRQELFVKRDVVTGFWTIGDNFKTSKYYNFYQNLLGDSKFIDQLETNGYSIQFLPHPTFLEFAKDLFVFDKRVKVLDRTLNYTEIFANSSLMITDFSSVIFDFVYLKKPVIYAHFDVDDRGFNYQKGLFFSYDDDGFGPITHTVEELEKTILQMIDKDCVIEDYYLERIHKFFKYNDKDNCKRILDAIQRM